MNRRSKEKGQVGRPKSDNPASERLPMVRITPDQLKRFKQSAKKSGKTFAEWVREALEEKAGKK